MLSDLCFPPGFVIQLFSNWVTSGLMSIAGSLRSFPVHVCCVLIVLAEGSFCFHHVTMEWTVLETFCWLCKTFGCLQMNLFASAWNWRLCLRGLVFQIQVDAFLQWMPFAWTGDSGISFIFFFWFGSSLSSPNLRRFPVGWSFWFLGGQFSCGLWPFSLSVRTVTLFCDPTCSRGLV